MVRADVAQDGASREAKMIDRVVLFGATGDLAARHLLPALVALHDAGLLPEGLTVVGASREELDDAGFRARAAAQLERHAPDAPAASRQAIVSSLHHRRVDLADEGQVAEVVRAAVADGGGAPVVVYLAVPPALFASAITALGAVELPPGSRVVVEKPFGNDAREAADLNTLLDRHTASAGSAAAYRVDHALGMATVHNLVAMRLGDPVLSSVWDSRHIDQVDVLWEETLALEGRAGYFDGTGALLDVVQNHVLQVLTLATMEPPAPNASPDVADRQVEVLRAVRPISDVDAPARTRRARYTAGTLADEGGGRGNAVPAYAEEDGVDPERRTETLAEVVLSIDVPRWEGTRFVLRAGKALSQRRKGLIVRFRPKGVMAPSLQSGASVPTSLWVGVDGPDDVRLELLGQHPGPPPPPTPTPLTLASPPPPAPLRPYASVMLDVLRQTSAMSVRGDVAEEAWRVIDPIVDAWRRDVVELQEYPAGSTGPPRLDPPDPR